MLTPVEIQNKSFKSGGLGYDKKDVDNFMREIVDSYEANYREKMELEDKVNVLNEALQNYKAVEKTMQKALVLAEKTAEDVKEAAQKDARRIENEARTKAQIMLSDAKNELERMHQQTVRLMQQYEKYKVQFKNLAAAQIELLESEVFQLKVMEPPKSINPSDLEEAPADAREAVPVSRQAVRKANDKMAEAQAVSGRNGTASTQASIDTGKNAAQAGQGMGQTGSKAARPAEEELPEIDFSFIDVGEEHK